MRRNSHYQVKEYKSIMRNRGSVQFFVSRILFTCCSIRCNFNVELYFFRAFDQILQISASGVIKTLSGIISAHRYCMCKPILCHKGGVECAERMAWRISNTTFGRLLRYKCQGNFCRSEWISAGTLGAGNYRW